MAIKAILNNVEKEIVDVKMFNGGNELNAWEVRDQQNHLIWGKEGTISGQTPLDFKAGGVPLTGMTLYGNTVQNGTPTPDNPIMPDFCGKLVGTDWTIPITCGGQTKTVYLGQTPTVRRIKKLVLTGEETGWTFWNNLCLFQLSGADVSGDFRGLGEGASCDHLPIVSYADRDINTFWWSVGAIGQFVINVNSYNLTQLKAYLADNPITIWYVLAEPETAIVNEPLMKIGDYADTITMTQAGIEIPTIQGQNTLTVDTVIQPSSITINGHII